MNPFFNPRLSLPFIKNFIFDPGKIERLSLAKLERYKDKALKKMIYYAYSVPLYKKKYKQIVRR